MKCQTFAFSMPWKSFSFYAEKYIFTLQLLCSIMALNSNNCSSSPWGRKNPQRPCCRIWRIQGKYIYLGKPVPRRMPNKWRSQSWLWLHEGESAVEKAAGRTPERKWLPKKSGGILCEGNRLAAYRFIQQYGHKYGVRWLLKRLNILPNAYYNFLKNRKSEYHKHKDKIKREIVDIYHSHNGTDGYRTVHAYLLRRGYSISRVTVHKYMNTELQLFSIARKRKPDYEYGAPHKVFENKFHQDFKSESINQKWCTDFTYCF